MARYDKDIAAGLVHGTTALSGLGALTGIDDQSSSNDDQITIKDTEVVINEDHDDLDFRVEGDAETHLLFVDGGNERVSIGDSVDAPAATLEVTNHASAGAFNVPLVQLNSNDTDKIAVDINAANIDANVIDVAAAALTSGKALYIDHNDTATTAVTPTTVHIDFDKSGVTADGVESVYTALDIDMNDAATNHANSTVGMTGLDIDIAHANAQGTMLSAGASIKVTGADSNSGLEIITTDGATSTDIKVMSSADEDDYFSISTTANGATTIATVDAGAAAAHLTLAPDGDIDLIGAKGVNAIMTPVVANFSDGDVRGDIIKMDHAAGSTATVAGKLYFLHTDGKWYGTDADNPIWSGENLLAIAVGTDPAVNGMLIKGLARIGGDASDASGDLITGTPLIGRRLFVSTANNSFSITAPTGVGDAVRGIGWVLQTTGNDMLIWFDPDVHFAEIEE